MCPGPSRTNCTVHPPIVQTSETTGASTRADGEVQPGPVTSDLHVHVTGHAPTVVIGAPPSEIPSISLDGISLADYLGLVTATGAAPALDDPPRFLQLAAHPVRWRLLQELAAERPGGARS